MTVEVATRLIRPHPLVTATRRAAESARRDDYGRLSVGPTAGVARLAVSRELLHRALLILHTLCREATRRGYSVVENPSSWSEDRGIAIEVDGHLYSLRIFELSDKVAMNETERDEWRHENKWSLSWRDAPTHRFVVNGRLKLSIPHHIRGSRSTWADGARGMIESKLEGVFIELERRRVVDDEAARVRAIEAAERERRLADERERALAEKRELERGERLQQQAAAWARVREVRAFIDELRRKLPQLERGERERVAEMCEWAENWIERNDPTQHLPDLAETLRLEIAERMSGEELGSPSRSNHRT